MATQRAEALLEKTNPASSCSSTESEETGENQAMAFYLMDCRRKQKHLFRQLSVVGDVIKLLKGQESVDQLLNKPVPRNPGSGARSAWKKIKAEYQEKVQQQNELIKLLVSRMEEVQAKRQKLESLLSALQNKKDECEEVKMAVKKNRRAEKLIIFKLNGSIQEAQKALSACDVQLRSLQEEVMRHQARVHQWKTFNDDLQRLVAVTSSSVQYRLLSVSPAQISLELRPHLPQQTLQSLRVSITVTTDDRFSLKVSGGSTGLVDETVGGSLREVGVALEEVMEQYVKQGEMLSEIQALHSRYPIDWCPAEKLLVFLKTANTVCRLRVEEGYPSRGRAWLLSVSKDGLLMDSAHLKPTAERPVLTDWLEFLSSHPDV